MENRACELETQNPVRLNWKEQFRLRSSLLKTADGVTLMGTEECRRCGALWYYDGRPPGQGREVREQHVYWYTPATPSMIEQCDRVEQSLGGQGAGMDAAAEGALDDLDAAMHTARGTRPWLRLVDQGSGAAWAAIGTWEPRPAATLGGA